MKIRCKNCGNEFDSKFCPSCGTPREESISGVQADTSGVNGFDPGRPSGMPSGPAPKKGAGGGAVLNVIRWIFIAFFAFMLLGSLLVKAWATSFFVILAILVISPLNTMIPVKLPKAIYGFAAFALFVVAIVFYPSNNATETAESVQTDKQAVQAPAQVVTAQQTAEVDKKTQKKITKIEKYIAKGKYDKAYKELSELEAPDSEMARLYAMYYSGTGDYDSAEKVLYDYCSKIEPLSDAENDPLYTELIGLYGLVPEKQEELDLFKHAVYVSKVGPEKGHDWKVADCTTAKTCTICGQVEGSPLGHDWADATCTEAKKCTRCGETEGEPLGHEVEDWKVTKKPSCSEEGTEQGICLRCGEEVEQAIAKTEHTAGKWEITKETTSAAVPGEKSLLCKVCGEVMETESYTITAEEELKIYKSSFEAVSYNDLARYPDSYKGKKVKVTVTIVDEIEEGLILFKPYKAKMGGKDIALSDGRDVKEPKLLKGDTVTVYGEGDGTETVKTKRPGLIFDKTVDSTEIPMVKILYCEIN
ncbi:MAG: hypothetical protein J5959_20460 [Butyrivibrio sp.]|nr:hypothetical protein [Butyrivibrio sp.]MBP3273992.1 hypothetical protein [Butyrivibrio sp.]